MVGALVLVGLFIMIFRSCYYAPKPESVLYGKWEMKETTDGYGNHILTFDWNGKYCDSNTGNEVWNYQFIKPDSLILFHHSFYEERYKIINLTQDTLMIKLSESIFHAVDNGIEVESQYGDGSTPIYTYVHIKE